METNTPAYCSPLISDHQVRWEEIPPCETLILKHLCQECLWRALGAARLTVLSNVAPKSYLQQQTLTGTSRFKFLTRGWDTTRSTSHITHRTSPFCHTWYIGCAFYSFKSDRWERERSSLMLLKGKKSSSNCLATSEQHLTRLDSYRPDKFWPVQNILHLVSGSGLSMYGRCLH